MRAASSGEIQPGYSDVPPGNVKKLDLDEQRIFE